MAQSILDYCLRAKSGMEWWQEINRQVANLEWWQISLILVAIIFVTILIGLSISYVITCFVFRSRVTLFFFFYMLFSKKHKPFSSSDLARHSVDTTIASPEAHETAKFPIPELLVEIEHNLKIVIEFSEDALLPLQTDVWDASKYSANKLSVDLREQLEQVYSEMHFLRQLIWLSTELSCRTPLVDELYRKKVTRITDKLQWIKQNMK